MEFKSINAEQGIDRVGNRINRIIMEFKSHQKSRTKGNQERINRIIMEFKWRQDDYFLFV